MNFRHNTLAIADQGVASLGNFLTVVLLARILAPADYGVFAILFGAILLLNGVHAALVVYPLSLEAALARNSQLARAISGGFVITLLFGVVGVCFLGFTCLMLQRWDLLAVTTFAVVLWQLQETCRRGLIAQSRFLEALWGDAISYIGQFIVICALWRLHRLSLSNIFGTVAVTSLAALIVQARQTGLVHPSREITRKALGRSVRLGKWAVLTHFVAMGPTIPMCVWLLGIFFVSSDAAVMQALGNILGITNPFILAMSGLSVPAAVRAAVNEGQMAAWKCAKKYGKLFAMLVLPCYLLLFLKPRLVISLVYGGNSHYLGWASILSWLALYFGLTFVAQVIGDFFRAIERMQVDFVANAGASIVGFAAFLIGVRHYSPLASAAFSLVAASACRTAILMWSSRRITRAAKRAQVSLVVSV
jgi:O-antigen/teichoic acid export membrane protein